MSVISSHALIAVILLLCLAGGLGGCAEANPSTGNPSPAAAGTSAAKEPTTTLVDDFRNPDVGCGWEPVSSLQLAYARCFTVDEYEGGYRLACLADGNRYLVVPEGATAPEGLAEDIIVLQQPIGDVYLVASDTMCLFEALDALDRISVSGIERDDWHSAAARQAMDEGAIVYGGKYRTPDYELLVAQGVRLAVESTMINHTPEVREKLLELGIPVLVELSSYESEPLGRAEWVKLYGILLGADERAQACFQEQVDQVAALREPSSGKTVAYFYLNSAGAAVVRRPGDYVTKMIEQAGGVSVFDQLEQATVGGGSTALQAEEFYVAARDADVLIYNATIDGGFDSVDELVAACPLLADCRAVQTGEVWVSDQDMYQQMLDTGGIIADFNRAICGADGPLTYLRKLS